MSGWLTAWGQPVPVHVERARHVFMGNAPSEGIMSEAEMAQLSTTSDVAFDRMWLQMMIKHH